VTCSPPFTFLFFINRTYGLHKAESITSARGTGMDDITTDKNDTND
jgi:hypothetical protein